MNRPTPKAAQPDFMEDMMNRYVRAYLAEPTERIAVIRNGIAQAEVVALAAHLDVPLPALRKLLRAPNGSGRCSAAASERILGLMALIGQVETMVRRNNPDVKFSASFWLGCWLSNPVGALGGIRPATLLDTMAGMALLSNLIALSESGAFA